jgi:hypothetical protein
VRNRSSRIYKLEHLVEDLLNFTIKRGPGPAATMADDAAGMPLDADRHHASHVEDMVNAGVICYVSETDPRVIFCE